MQPRTTGMLLLIALALGAFIYIYEIRGGEARRAAEEEGRRIFHGLSADRVGALELTTRDGVEVRAERADGHWRIVSPLEFPGDDVALDAMAGTLARLTSESRLDSPREASVYGLGEEARRVHVFSGADTFTLRIGKETPVGENRYVSIGRSASDVASSGVYILPSWRLKSFESPFEELRDRQVLAFERDEVVELEVRWGEGAVSLIRSGDDWRFVTPEALRGERADASVIDGMLSELRLVRADGFVDLDALESEQAGAGAERLAGFEEPYFDLTMRLREGPVDPADAEQTSDPAMRELRFSLSEVSSDGDRLARAAYPRTLFRIDASKLAVLPRRLFAFRYKTISRFDLDDAEAVELRFTGADEAPEADPLTVRIERRDGSWVPVGDPWVAGATSRLVAELARLDGSAIFAEALGEAELATLGLDSPEVAIEVHGAGADTPPLAEVHLGRRGPSGGILAKSAERDTVYRLDPALEAQIPTTLEAFREHFLDRTSVEIDAAPKLEDAAGP